MFAGGDGEFFVWILVMTKNVFGLVKGVLLTAVVSLFSIFAIQIL